MHDVISKNSSKKTVLTALKSNSMTIFFAILAAFLAVSSGDTLGAISGDTSIRFFRNLLLTVALIFPIMAGVGLNFGIVLGAMSAQVGLVVLMALGLANSGLAFVYWMILTIFIATASGYLLALLFNNTKGQEMIAGLMVGFFANGLYMLLLMVVLGGIIKLSDPLLVVSPGTPIKGTINLSDAMYGRLDNAVQVPYFYIAIAAFVLLILFLIFKLVKKLRTGEEKNKLVLATSVKIIAATAVFAFLMVNGTISKMLKSTNMPILTCLFCIAIMLFTWRVMRSKLGHDFVSVRNDINISASVGINVDRIRTTAIILSTIIAGLGQMIYIQNLGALNTYTTHNNVATYAISAILIGGATVKNASLKNTILGNILFQIIYGCAPNAAKVLIGNVQIGEYFRVFLCYGIITVAIVSYAIKELNAAKLNRESNL